jgi:hypothetical protein
MEERYQELIDEAYYLPYGDSKIALLEEAIRIADAHLSFSHQYHARMGLTEAAVMSGRVEKGIVSFAWCLANFERGDHHYSDYTIIWHYKWICGNIKEFPDVSKAKIEEMLEDYRQWLQKAGYNLRSYYKLQRSWAEHRGDSEQAQQYFAKWQETEDDVMTDCEACEVNSEVYYWLNQGQFDTAYEKAQPLLKGGLTCHSVPQTTYSELLLPLLERGRKEEADTFYQRCYKGIHGESGFTSTAGDLIKYLVVVNQEKAISVFEEFVNEVYQSRVPLTKYDFYLPSSLLLSYLTPDQQKLLRMPEGLTPEKIETEMREIAVKFDQRNGTPCFTQRIGELKERIARLKRQYPSS